MAKSKKTKIVMSARTPHASAHPTSKHVVSKGGAKGKIKNGKSFGKKVMVKC